MPGKSRLAYGARHLALIGRHAFALGEETPRSPIRVPICDCAAPAGDCAQGDRQEFVFSGSRDRCTSRQSGVESD
jgi:hypothetical protein